jgi:hypothetical protein
VTWLTFWATHREKLAAQQQHRRDELDILRGAVEAIRPWAQTTYTGESHDPSWYNVSWTVLPLPMDIESLERLATSGGLPEGVSAAAVRLAAAARRFHEMLAQHLDYIRAAQRDIALRWPAVVVASEAKGGPLVDDELQPTTDNRWLQELYRRNKAIHVEGIGGPGGNGLHEALRLAAAELDPARERLGQAAREPWWMRWGHGLAAAFVLAGVILLGAFYGSLIGEAFHRAFPQRPAASASSKQLAPRATASAPDTMKTRLPGGGETAHVNPRMRAGARPSAGSRAPGTQSRRRQP